MGAGEEPPQHLLTHGEHQQCRYPRLRALALPGAGAACSTWPVRRVSAPCLAAEGTGRGAGDRREEGGIPPRPGREVTPSLPPHRPGAGSWRGTAEPEKVPDALGAAPVPCRPHRAVLRENQHFGRVPRSVSVRPRGLKALYLTPGTVLRSAEASRITPVRREIFQSVCSPFARVTELLAGSLSAFSAS